MHIRKKLSGSLKNSSKMVKESLEGESESPVLPDPLLVKVSVRLTCTSPRSRLEGGLVELCTVEWVAAGDRGPGLTT